MSSEPNNDSRPPESTHVPTPAVSNSVVPSRPSIDPSSSTCRDPLASRIEHTRLRVQVAALERELVATANQQQAIIDQYELLLEDRQPESCHGCSEPGVLDTIRQLISRR